MTQSPRPATSNTSTTLAGVNKYRRLPLHTKVLLGLLIGTLLGLVAHAAIGPDTQRTLSEAVHTHSECSRTFSTQMAPWIRGFSEWIAIPIGQLFLRLIFVMVLPLMLSALITASAKLGSRHAAYGIALKALAAALFLALCASLISLFLVNLLQPGVGLEKHAQLINLAGSVTLPSQEASTLPWTQRLVAMIPLNPFEAIADCVNPHKESSIVAVIGLCIALGITLSRCSFEKVKPLIDLLDAILEMSRTYLSAIMELAPYAVAALIFSNTLEFGFDLLKLLSRYVICVLFGLLMQVVVVYGATLRLMAKTSLFSFLRKTKLISLTAFSTSSSNATLPISIDVSTQAFNLDKDLSRFILTLGASANQNGSALYEGITVLFLAQLYQVDLSFLGQMMVIGMSMVASLGTAGVPGGTLPLMITVLASLGIPTEGLVLILGVERILDMSRTVVNSLGDVVIALWVDRSVKASEKVIDPTSQL